MSKKNSRIQNSRGIDLPSQLNLLLIQYFFPESQESNYTNPPKKVLETKCQTFIKLIQDKLSEKLRHRSESKMIFLLSSKLNESEIKAFTNGKYDKEIISAKTLKRCYDQQRASRFTIGVLEAFHEIIEEEQAIKKQFLAKISRVAGSYYVYATHNTNRGTFQESMFQIYSDGTSLHKFKNSSRKIIFEPFEINQRGTLGLLMRFHEENYSLIFFLYTGEIKRPPFLQAVHMYTNREGNTVANLAILQRMKKVDEVINEENDTKEFWFTKKMGFPFIEKFNPERELKKLNNLPGLDEVVKSYSTITVKENIQRFLANRVNAFATLTYRGQPFNFQEKPALLPSSNSNNAKHYVVQSEFVGTYDLYFNERYPSVERIGNRSGRTKYFSSVGIGVLKIEIDKISGQLICNMRMKRSASNENPLIFSGKVINETLTDSSTLILSMYLEPSQHRYLHLLLNVVDENKLIGCFNIAYTLPTKLGAGVAMAIRQYKDNENEEPASISVNIPSLEVRSLKNIDSEGGAKSKTRNRILNFLSKTEHSLVIPPDFNNLKEYSDNIYRGVYRMYYEGRNKHTKDKELRINTLIIFQNGEVSLRTPENGNVAFGKCEIEHDMLNITLREKQMRRTGFYCIRVDNRPPLEREEICYSGSFAGYSLSSDKVPMASQFLLQFIKSESHSIKDWIKTFREMKLKNKNKKEIPEQIINFFKNQKANLRFSKPIFKLDDLNSESI